MGKATSKPIGPNAERHVKPTPLDARKLPESETSVPLGLTSQRDAEIGEYTAGHGNFRWQTQRECHLKGARIEILAAERVIRRRVTRAEAGGLEAPQRIAAEEEAVGQPDVLSDADNGADTAADLQHEVVRQREELGQRRLVADEPLGAAQAGQFVGDAGIPALGRVEPAVPRIVGQRVSDLGQGFPALGFLDVTRRVVVDVGNLVDQEGVLEPLRQPFRDRVVGAQRKALAIEVVGRFVLQVLRRPEQIDAAGNLATEEIRVGEREIELAAAPRQV